MERLEVIGVDDVDEGKSRSENIQQSFNYVEQITQNWILLHYCTRHGRTITKSHWQYELEGQLWNASKFKIGNNTFDERLQALTSKWLKEKMDNPNKIYKYIKNKLKKEKLDISAREIDELIYDFMANETNIIKIISYGDPSKIKEYSRSDF